MMKPLIAQSIPLNGKHLIESSAGTGKTFNITRIYLRLLLEKSYTVEQILVMTFTKDATEELRGRIGEEIRNALLNWESLINKDEFYQSINEKVPLPTIKVKLQQALLFLDEAAIFTLHGFCKSVLSQYAFASGLPFNAQMETNSKDLMVEACQDYYRIIAKQNIDDYLLLTEFWPIPESFIKHFSTLIFKSSTIDIKSREDVYNDFNPFVQKALDDLLSNQSFLYQHLIDVKKGKDREVREQEFQQLISWCEEVLIKGEHALSKPPTGFIDGRRFPKPDDIKSTLVDIVTSTNVMKTAQTKLEKAIHKITAFSLVRDGIYQIRSKITEKKLKQEILTFDDLIKTLAELLSSKQHASLKTSLLNDYPVALVDEFQDTDPLQFNILTAIYGQDETSGLYLIGDPKQAIYGFRGGDVFTYLTARDFCQYHWLMETNWRSSVHVINGYNRLFYGNHLESEGKPVFGSEIPYQPVLASPKASDIPPIDNNYKALQFIAFHDGEHSEPLGQNIRPTMAMWCANEIARLLRNENCRHKLQAQDIAVLVRDGTEATNIQEALQQVGLAAVYLSNKANLWHSDQTVNLLRVLKGIVYVESDKSFTNALTSNLLGFDSQRLYALQQDEMAWQNIKFDFISLRQEWQHKSFISMALKLMHNHFSVRKEGKDRTLTNILHLFELLQAASQQHRQPQELLYWFEQQYKLEMPEMDAELRLESDDNIIKIVTQHGSKGLEYPVVFIPYATRHKDPLKVGNRTLNVIDYHDDNGQMTSCLDGNRFAKQRMIEENYAESVRLLYVATTRAVQRCYIAVANFENAEFSPLGRTLQCEPGSNVIDTLQTLVDDNPNDIGIEVIDIKNVISDTFNGQMSVEERPQVAEFGSSIERDWWLSSFSALSKNIRHYGISTPDRDSELPAIKDDLIESSEVRFTLVKGAQTGNFLHDVLEYIDFSSPQWSAVLSKTMAKYANVSAGTTENELQAWFAEIISTPLYKNTCLKDFSLNKTLREVEFYFPMEDAKSESLTKLLTDHRNKQRIINNNQQTLNKTLPSVLPVQLPAYKTLKGMMHGFIDLIFESDGKYYVCDYKSSHLGDSYNDYRGENLIVNVEKNHYDLQYLIYSLALHRQLKHTLEDYNVSQHFGGVYYLYLRGMSNKSEYRGKGVYFNEISEDILNQLDELFSSNVNTELQGCN